MRGKTYSVILLTSIVLVLFSGCQRSLDSHNTAGLQAKPLQQNSGPDVSPSESSEAIPFSLEQTVSRMNSQTRISMNPDDYILQVIDGNLDIDQIEEQVIVFKKKNDPEDRIRVLVADFDNVRNIYIPAWQGETQGTNTRTFTIYLQDLVGDHIQEMLCFGRNNKGEQTLDVFRKAPSPHGLGIYYIPILSLFSDGSIEVDERARSESYQLLQRSDESFSVSSYQRDPDSKNIMDIVKSTYYWSHQENKYVFGKTEKIPGQVVAEKQLADLFAKDSDGFESYLNGPWYRTSSEKQRESGSSGEIMYFDSRNRRISFYNGEIQESLVWMSSYRTIYRGLFINCSNEAISSITKQLSISVTGMDTLDLQIKGGEGWDGQYKRLGKDLQNAYLTAKKKAATLSPIDLNGLYRNESGLEIYFSSPNLTLRENGKELSGGYVVYNLGENILEMKIMKNSGLVDSERTYRLQFTEQIQGPKIVRDIVLQPAVVTISGMDTKPGQSLKLQQIVDKE